MFLISAAATLVSIACLGISDDRPPPLSFDTHVDYIAWYNEFVSKGKKDNAYELYKGLMPDKKGAGGIPAPTGEAEKQADKQRGHLWEAKTYPELVAYLKDCAPFLDIFRKAGSRRDYWRPAPADTKLLRGLAFPDLSSCRTATKATLMQALMKQEGQFKVVNDACGVVLQSANHMQQSRNVIGVLVGSAERASVYDTVAAALADGVVDDKDVGTLYATLRRWDPGSADQTHWLSFEWAVSLDTLQFVCVGGKSDQAKWDELLNTLDENTPPTENNIKAPDPKEALRLVEEHFSSMAKILSKPLSLKTARQLDKFEHQQTAKNEKNTFTAIFFAKFSRAYALQLRVEAQRRATLLILAIHAHHAKHRKWPKSLDQIDKDLGLEGLDQARIDPFSGNDFIYKLRGGEPLLYSVSSNGEDDGGRHEKHWGDNDKDSDYVFWPLQR